MIGKKVRVFWPVDNSWYTGTVRKYDAKTGEHQLQYPDGEYEWVKIGEIRAKSDGNEDSPLTPHVHNEARDLPPPPEVDRAGKWPTEMRAPPYYGSPGGGGYPPPSAYSLPPYVAGGVQPSSYMYPPPYGSYSGYSVTPGEKGVPDSRTGRKSGPKPWTKEEDALLLRLAHTMQWPIKWTIVAQNFVDRTGKQCRERYVNHLNPRLKTSDWTPVEDAQIFHLYNTIGSHWAKMSKVIPGRTDNGIKNRFHNIRRQYEREDKHRMRLSSAKDFPNELRLDRLRKFPDHMVGRSAELWDMKSAVGVLAAQSVTGVHVSRANDRFGPFREAAAGDVCVRCGLLVPSLHCGTELCTKTGWCQSCARVPPNVSGNLLRECLNLRREKNQKLRDIIETWVDYFIPDAENAWPYKEEEENKAENNPESPEVDAAVKAEDE
jgi:hypothetical protein